MNEAEQLDKVHLSLSGPGEEPAAHFHESEYMKRYLDLIVAHGGLFDQVQAAKFAGVTKQRINALVKTGKLRTVSLSIETPHGPMLIEQTITGHDLEAFLAAPKSKGGRPMHRPRQLELQAA